MPPIVIESKLFREQFGTEKMRALFSDENTVGRYLEVEAALAQAQGKLGVIPLAAAEAIEQSVSIERIDWEKLARRTQIVGYPILPLVEQIVEWVKDGLGQYCHWGATTQDIMDTADVLQIRAALDLIAEDLAAIAGYLAEWAERYADTPMAGRTHLQHALPISFGYKCATWLSAIERHRCRLKELRPRVEVAQLSGAAGTLASLGDDGLRVQEAFAAALGLGVPSITWHTIRDGFTETTGFLALLCGTIGKIGYDIMLMMQTEIAEVREPFVEGRGASSTMPQKRNPIASEIMLASAKIVREQHGAMLDAMVQDHERATGQWHVEWHALPTGFIVASGGLRAAREVLAGLEVRPEAMRAVLAVGDGLIMAEAVMMALAPHLGRQNAHDIVYACCREAEGGDGDFLATLAVRPEIAAIFSREQLADILDPASYMGAAPTMARLMARCCKRGV